MKDREWNDYSPEEKLIAINAYLRGMAKLDDGDAQASRERLEWIREHLPAYNPKDGKNYIFVSYSHLDYRAVYADLAYFTYNPHTRVRFWYDEGLPIGADWERAAGGCMSDPHCAGVVFYLSKNLLLSPSVFKEIQTVKKLKKPYCTVALGAEEFSAARIFDNALGRELRDIRDRQSELEEFFPETHTALIYGRDNARSRIAKISDIFDVTEEVLSDFICEEVAGGLRLTGYAGNKTEVFIPSHIDGKKVTEIMAEFEHAVKIHIPNTVVKIYGKKTGHTPFRFSESLEEIKVAIDNECFFDLNGALCDRREKSIICAPLRWNWRRQFAHSGSYKNNKNLDAAQSSIDAPDIMRLGYAFAEQFLRDAPACSYEAEIRDVADIYASLYTDNLSCDEYRAILESPEKRFNIYKDAKSKSVFSAITKIDGGAFEYCRDITYLFLPDGIKDIRTSAFERSNIRLVFLPQKLEAIEMNAFCECARLRTVLTDDYARLSFLRAAVDGNVPETDGMYCLCGQIRTIRSRAFYGTPVETLVTCDGLTAIDNTAFFGCGKLKTLTIPGTVAEIDEQSFAECALLREVGLRDGVKRIGAYAFAKCASLRTITIPRSTEYIDLSAFIGCESLETVIFEGTYAMWQRIAFISGGKKVGFNTRSLSPARSGNKKFTLECTDMKLIDFRN